MSTQEELLVQESTTEIIPTANRSPPTARLGHFLLPRADGARLPALPSPPRNGGPVLGDELRMEWRGWPGSSKPWRRWVANLRPQHEGLWRRVGILDAILATTRRVRRDEGLLLQLMAFWSKETSTFVFPWGEATVTLEDMAALGGLPLLGNPVSAVLPDALCGDVAALKAIRSVLNRSKSKKASYSTWVKYFLDRPPADDVAAAGRGGGDAAAGLLEHGAFLAMWLSAYVLPSTPFGSVQERLFPIAAQLARGQRVALAPAALAGIYSCLSTLAGCAPLLILQLWVWERFPELRPEKRVTPDNNDGGVPARAAQWHNATKALDPIYIRAVFMSPERFEWTPYYGTSSSIIGLPPGRRVHGQDIARSDELLSMALCVRPCELVGIDCIEQYCPHRVARQLGFDQDVPGDVRRVNSDPGAAWATYEMEARAVAFIAPQGEPGVTVDYARWWEPYSSTCAAGAVHRQRKREMEEVVCIDDDDDDAENAQPQDSIPPVESLTNGEAIVVDVQSSSEDMMVIGDDESDEESEKDATAELVTSSVERVVCTRSLYYLRPFELAAKDGQLSAGGTNSDQGFFQPKREVGTAEMIKQASEAREAEKAELEKRIDCLKKQIWG